jgi:hypothetical protein
MKQKQQMTFCSLLPWPWPTLPSLVATTLSILRAQYEGIATVAIAFQLLVFPRPLQPQLPFEVEPFQDVNVPLEHDHHANCYDHHWNSTTTLQHHKSTLTSF